MHLNSVIPTKGSYYMNVGVKDFYYRMPMEKHECGHFLLELLPKQIIE